MSKKDYYEILGVPKTSDLQQIKKAYRSLALKHHPDRVPEEQKKDAEEKFKEISEAYGVLSDPQKRQLYDQHGHSGIDQNYTSEDIFRGADFNSIFGEGGGGIGDIFSQLFGDSLGGQFSSGGGRSNRPRRGRDIQYEVEITLEEAFTGMHKQIKVPRHEVCETCKGSGAKPGTTPKTCSTCKGQGQVFTSAGFFRMAQTCPTCGGQGKIITDHCPECHGRGDIKVTRNIDVTIPAGVDNDTRLRMRGEGEVSTGGAGDLYLYISIQHHAIFERTGRDLQMELPLSFVVAAIGGEVSVPTLNGPVSMKIPAGTQSGKVFRLRNKGMPDVHGSSIHGDQYVRVMIQVPTKLTNEQRRLLEEFAKVSGQDLGTPDSFKEKLKNVFK